MATIIVATGLFVGSASITGKIIRMSGLLKARYSPALQLGLGGKAAELESLLAYTSDETKYVLLNREGDESSSTRAQLANHSSFKLNRRGTRSANTSASTQLSPAEIANRHVMQAAAEHIEPNISNRLKALLRQAGKTVKPKKPKKTTAEKMKEWRKKDVEYGAYLILKPRAPNPLTKRDLLILFFYLHASDGSKKVAYRHYWQSISASTLVTASFLIVRFECGDAIQLQTRCFRSRRWD